MAEVAYLGVMRYPAYRYFGVRIQCAIVNRSPNRFADDKLYGVAVFYGYPFLMYFKWLVAIWRSIGFR